MLLAIGHFCIKNVLTFFIWSNGSEKNPILPFYLINSPAEKDPRWIFLFFPVLGTQDIKE